jgi:hypothetical protein
LAAEVPLIVIVGLFLVVAAILMRVIGLRPDWRPFFPGLGLFALGVAGLGVLRQDTDRRVGRMTAGRRWTWFVGV